MADRAAPRLVVSRQLQGGVEQGHSPLALLAVTGRLVGSGSAATVAIFDRLGADGVGADSERIGEPAEPGGDGSRIGRESGASAAEAPGMPVTRSPTSRTERQAGIRRRIGRDESLRGGHQAPLGGHRHRGIPVQVGRSRANTSFERSRPREVSRTRSSTGSVRSFAAAHARPALIEGCAPATLSRCHRRAEARRSPAPRMPSSGQAARVHLVASLGAEPSSGRSAAR